MSSKQAALPPWLNPKNIPFKALRDLLNRQAGKLAPELSNPYGLRAATSTTKGKLIAGVGAPSMAGLGYLGGRALRSGGGPGTPPNLPPIAPDEVAAGKLSPAPAQGPAKPPAAPPAPQGMDLAAKLRAEAEKNTADARANQQPGLMENTWDYLKNVSPWTYAAIGAAPVGAYGLYRAYQALQNRNKKKPTPLYGQQMEDEEAAKMGSDKRAALRLIVQRMDKRAQAATVKAAADTADRIAGLHPDLIARQPWRQLAHDLRQGYGLKQAMDRAFPAMGKAGRAKTAQAFGQAVLQHLKASAAAPFTPPASAPTNLKASLPVPSAPSAATGTPPNLTGQGAMQ